MKSSETSGAKSRVVVSIYSHPDYFPPTINAIWRLSEAFDEIDVVCNNVASDISTYPPNVRLHPVGSLVPVRQVEKVSTWQKIKRFIQFTAELRRQLARPTDISLSYDLLALYADDLACRSLFRKPKRRWYHNHDVLEKSFVRKGSISWFAKRNEPAAFSRIDIFSLPAVERKEYFPLEKFNGKFFFIPNFPSKAYYSKFADISKPVNELRIIFQGSIGPGHGLEEICGLLPLTIHNRPVKLILKGFVSEAYRKQLQDQAAERNAAGSLEFVGITPYEDVPKLTAGCHIGIAVFTGGDVMNRTLGTASNKIYEYAACGLPVIYFDSPHYRQYLSNYNWAVPTDLTAESLINAFEHIESNYPALSQSASASFNADLNFETHFNSVISSVNHLL